MLLDRFVELCRVKGPELKRRLDPRPTTEMERQWAEATQARWLPLPPPSQQGRQHVFAADGSGHSVRLSNGLYVVIAQAFLAGPTPEDTRDAVDLEIQPPRRRAAGISDLRDLMMRRLEAQVAVETAHGMHAPEP